MILRLIYSICQGIRKRDVLIVLPSHIVTRRCRGRSGGAEKVRDRTQTEKDRREPILSPAGEDADSLLHAAISTDQTIVVESALIRMALAGNSASPRGSKVRLLTPLEIVESAERIERSALRNGELIHRARKEMRGSPRRRN
jgi:hypothetical protein